MGEDESNKTSSPSAYARLRWPGVISLSVGCLMVTGYGIAQDHPLQSAAIGILISLAAAVLGALVGLVFGIPRQVETSPDTVERAFIANTNLQQVSDWIVKIIIALGLIELTSLATWFADLSRSLGAALGPPPSSTVVAASTIAFFTSAGFFFGFLWTSMDLMKALNEAAGLDLTKTLENLRELADRTAQQAAEDPLEVMDPGQFEHREVIRNPRVHPADSAPDLGSLWQNIKDVLADSLRPLDDTITDPGAMIEALQKYGVIDLPLAQNLSSLAKAVRAATDGAQLSKKDETAVRFRGTSAIRSLAKLIGAAPRLLEQHVIATLRQEAEPGWNILGDQAVGEVTVDALVEAYGRHVVVEVKVIDGTPSGRPDKILEWLLHITPDSPVILILAGRYAHALNLNAFPRPGVTRVLMWDSESNHITEAVADLLSTSVQPNTPRSE